MVVFEERRLVHLTRLLRGAHDGFGLRRLRCVVRHSIRKKLEKEEKKAVRGRKGPL